MKIDPVVKDYLKRYFQDTVSKLQKKITVRTAYELNNAEKQLLFSKFSTFFKAGSVNYVVQPDIIGGFVINAGSKVIDLSLKGKLTNLKNILYESV